MNIRRDLPQFNERRALIVVTGRFAAELYVAHRGVIGRFDGFQLVWPRYQDNEGFFEQRGKDMTRISGSVRETKERERVKRFIRELRVRVWRAVVFEKPDVVFLFTPKIQEVKDGLQERIRRLIVAEVRGDYIRKHPFDVLTKIKTLQRALDVSTSGSTASSRKMLRKAAIMPQKHKTWA